MNMLKDAIDFLTKLLTWWVVVMPWEQGVRVTFGNKIKILNKGIHLKVPFVHVVYVQEKRLRVIQMPMQTLSTMDNHAITIACSIGYKIVDIYRLYDSIYKPDMTINNICLGKISDIICSRNFKELHPSIIEEEVIAALGSTDFGLEFKMIKIVNYASVRTYRLINEGTYMHDGLDLRDNK